MTESSYRSVSTLNTTFSGVNFIVKNYRDDTTPQHMTSEMWYQCWYQFMPDSCRFRRRIGVYVYIFNCCRCL